MVFPIAAALTAGASIFGTLFGGGEKKTTNEVDYRKMVRNAEAAGFNPLTALRNGGAAGFSSTTTPALSPGAMLGEAAGAVGDFLKDFDPHADTKRELEFGLVQAQIANLNAGTAAQNRLDRPGSFNVPTYTAGTKAKPPMGVKPLAGDFIGPRLPKGAGPNGEILDTHQTWRNQQGKLIDIVHNDMPDTEQFPVPALAEAENAIVRPIMDKWDAERKGGGLISKRPLTPEEQKGVDESWHGGWLPTFEWK